MRHPVARLLYQVGVALTLLGAGPFLLASKGRHYLATLTGRLGGGSAPDPTPRLWLHAVSVGEVAVAATLARALPPELPLLVTTVTPTGQERARVAFSQQRAAIAYLPFDLGFALRRFLGRFRPTALVLVEGDYWPLLLARLAERDLPIVVVNGRVSDRSFGRLAALAGRWPRLLDAFFAPVARFGMQTGEDARRLEALGVPAERVRVTGNLKYETTAPADQPDLLSLVRRLAAGRPVLVAGSTMAGEEEAVLGAFRRAGGGGRALLVLAPRHPERFAEVERLVARSGLAAARRSGSPAAADLEVLLLDTLGELAALYALAEVAFIGGTLVPKGGHNPLEAARFGVPVVVGPSMENFREIADAFDHARAWRRVADAAELATAFDQLLGEPAAARELGARGAGLIEANRGALTRTLEMLGPWLAT
ncbi:MAG TPA: 3-deoxy-D-manno-octulosonic acid transferase [Thermoanaerobaculia bacterium]|nr:3-deoxy-D-manno-octulosonic acid transferase [Thermoanaerobaculia bacterium]